MVDLLELGFIVVYSFVDVVICKTGKWMMDSLEMFFYRSEERRVGKEC